MSCGKCTYDLEQHRKTFLIRNPQSNLVLDAKYNEVKARQRNQSSDQLWTLECIDYGRFIIVNQGNGKLLTIAGAAEGSAKLITEARNPGFVDDNQQWHLSQEGVILCPAGGRLAVDLPDKEPGTTLIVWPRHGDANQIFKFEYI